MAHTIASPPTRSGTTAVECAVTLPVLLFILFALLDVGVAAVRYNALSDMARRIAREAAIRGSEAPGDNAEWGPDEFVGTLADGNDIVAAAAGITPTMAADQVNVRVTWPEGSNSARDPVQVEVDYRHVPLVPTFSVLGEVRLRSAATMRIVN